MTDLERYEAAKPLRVSPEDAAKYARAFAASKMFSAGYSDATADQIFTQIMVGSEYGFGPGASMVNLHVMDGKPELSANAQASFIKASGRYDYRVTEHTDKVCEITVVTVPNGEVVAVERYTWEDAERQELTSLTKRGNKTAWHKTPRNMLFARCISNVCAFHCPDVVPMRTYSPGEISGHEGEERKELSPAALQEIAQIEQRVKDDRDPPEVETVEDAEVVEDETDGWDPETEILPEPVQPPILDPNRFSREAVETKLRQDLPKLSDADKQLVKTAVTSARPAVKWGYSGITSLIVKAGFTDVNTWIHLLLRPGTRQTLPASSSQGELTPVGESLPQGVTGAKTGSQTAPTVSDAQVRMLHARMSACLFDEQEKRYFLSHYAGAASTRDVKKSDVDDLLQILSDIEQGDDATRKAYLGGVAN